MKLIVAHYLNNSLANFQDLHDAVTSISDISMMKKRDKSDKETEKQLIQLLIALQTLFKRNSMWENLAVLSKEYLLIQDFRKKKKKKNSIKSSF